MATYRKFSDLPEIAEASEVTKVPVLDGGEMKLLDGSKLGGAGIKTAIIKDSEYDNVLAGLATASASLPTVTYTCENMTFDEAYAAVLGGGVLMAVMKLTEGETMAVQLLTLVVLIDTSVAIPCLAMMSQGEQLYWSANGISTENPNAN